jgi:flagellar biosynthesis/type III secretory pathway chaperone
MTTAEGSMEALFQEKLRLYENLAALLEQEKKQVVGADVAELWKISDQKQRLVEEVIGVQGRMLRAASAMSIDHGMTPENFQTFRFLSLLPGEQRRRLGGVEASLRALKTKIREISLESKRYIESRLGMINELMTIMTGQEHRRQQGYGPASAGTGAGTAMLFRGEV